MTIVSFSRLSYRDACSSQVSTRGDVPVKTPSHPILKMHGSILPHNIVLIAFVLHNLTPSQAGSLFFPKYLHSPKFTLAMKSFRQELSKYVRSVFVDLSLNVASKFKGLYGTLDTYADENLDENLASTLMLQKKSRTQPARQSSRSKSELETKPTPEENLLSTSDSSEFDTLAINSVNKAMNELSPNVKIRTNQNKVRMKNSTKRKKPRLRGRLLNINSSNRQKINDSKKSVGLGHFNSKASSDDVNNSIMYPGVTNTEKDSVIPRILTNPYVSISETIVTRNFTHQSDLVTANMPSRLPGKIESHSNRKENQNVHHSTFIVGHRDFYNFSGIDQTPTITFIPKGSETALHSNSYANSLLLRTPSVGTDTRGDTNETLKNGLKHSDLESRFSGPYQSSERSTLEKNSGIDLKQPLLPAPTEDGGNITYKHTAELSVSKPILMTEEERKLLFRKSRRGIGTRERTSFHRRKLTASSAKLGIFQPFTRSILTKHPFRFDDPSTLSSARNNTNRIELKSTALVNRTESYELKAINEKNKFGSQIISKGGSKADRPYHEYSSRKISARNNGTTFPAMTRPHEVMIKSRIKKRAAYDAMMNMIASKWAKMNNEEAESEEPVTDDDQYDDHFDANMKDSIKLPTTKRMYKADHENFQSETHDFSEPVKISKHHEASPPHDINGKISNLCLSFEAMNRKKTTQVSSSDQPDTTESGMSTSSVAAPAKLKRSFSERNNQTNKAVKRKRKRKSNKLKTATVTPSSASETDRLLGIALEQFEDKLKSIIQSSWPRKNFRDPAQKSEEFAGGSVRTSSSLTQSDLHAYVLSTCKQTWDQLQRQHASETEDATVISEQPEEFANEGIRTTDLAGTSMTPLTNRRYGSFTQTFPHNRVTKKTQIEVQKISTGRNTPLYSYWQIDDLREPISDEQRNLENASNPGLDVDELRKSLKNQQFCSPPCVPVTGPLKSSSDNDEEKVILIGTLRTTTSSTTTEKYLESSKPQYPKLKLPVVALTGMPEKFEDHEALEASIFSVPNNNKNTDDYKNERVYQPSLEKPNTTWKLSNKSPNSRHATRRPLAKDNIMRLDRKLENFFASSGDATASLSQNPENLRRSIENFKKIARLNRELLKNIDADDGFSIADLNLESLGLSSLLNEPTEGTKDDIKDEIQEDETETPLATQSSDDVTQRSVISLITSPLKALTPSIQSKTNEGHVNDEFTTSNTFTGQGSAQSFREVTTPHKCLKANKTPPSRLFTRSDTHGYYNQGVLSAVDRTVSPRTFFTQGRSKLKTTSFNEDVEVGNEQISQINKPESFGQNHNYKDPYSSESARYGQQSKEEDELVLPVQDPRYNADDQNQKSAQVQLAKPVILLQRYSPDSVSPLLQYDIIPMVDETLESYGGSSTDAAVDINDEPFLVTEFREPYVSSATEEMVSESDYNPPTIKSKTDSYSVEVEPDVLVPQLRNKATSSYRGITTAKMATHQGMRAPAMTQPQQLMRLQSGQQVESNAHMRRKDVTAYKTYHLRTTGKPRVSYSTSAPDDRRPFGTKYLEEESQHQEPSNTAYHDESLTTHRPHREKNPFEESQKHSTPKLRYKTAKIQKQEISSIEPPSVESNFYPKFRRPLNRTSSRKRHRARKSWTRVGTSDSEHSNRTSGINHMPSTDNFFEKFQNLSENNVRLKTDKSSFDESMDERHPEKGGIEEVSKAESHMEETVPRLFPLSESRGKGIRFYNRGNHPLSQLYGKEYATSRYYSSTLRHQFSSSTASISEPVTVIGARIRPYKRVQQTSQFASNGHHKMRSNKRRFHSRRRKTTTLVTENTDEEDSTGTASL